MSGFNPLLKSVQGRSAHFLLSIVTIFFLLLTYLPASAQQDTTRSWSRNFISGIMGNFRRDTALIDNKPRRIDEVYKKYDGLIIREIYAERIPFGIAFSDTGRVTNTLIRLSNTMHHLTKVSVIKRNLFFKENDTIQHFLLGDNERFLRQLPYFQDAQFLVVPVDGTDSADIIVVTKDLFTLGGEIGSLGFQKSDVQVREDNIRGGGNAFVLYALYDAKRKGKVALGSEYIQRNIGGSFLDAKIGYQSYYNSFNAPKEENFYYFNVVKPLVNRYQRWTYELNLSYNETRNRYYSDSIYKTNFRYNFYNIDAWTAYNLHAKNFGELDENSKLRKLLGLRVIERQTKTVPLKFDSLTNWEFADLTAVLGTVSFYRQNFYKTKYIYGFGRNEDIPEGLLLTLTGGYTIKEKEKRPFIGFNYERSYFNTRKNYVSYKLRAEGYLNDKSLEDISLLVSVFYFDRLKRMGLKWNQRFFINFDVAKEIKPVLNEPLFINSIYGIPQYGNLDQGGTFRGVLKAESVFFSPWSVASFRFAPFLFSNLAVYSPYYANTRLFSSLGGGLRTNNESLVFGTIELKAYFFPQKNLTNDRFRFDISTNVRFKYKTQFVQKPDFIEVN
ncbi:MAG: hypothetical protein ABI266_03520 [Ginsengibacter sp.]